MAEYGAEFTGASVQQEYGYRAGSLLVTASGYGEQGLQADYFNSLDFTNPALTRTDPTVNFEWHSVAPGAGVNADVFTARWTGYVTPRYTETYTFYTQSDDGVRLWVNGQLLVDKWIDQGWTEWSGQITLEAGKRYEIRMEFYERYWGAIAKLFWSSASQPKEIVPASQLSPPQGSAVKWLVNDQLGTPRMALDQSGSLAKVTRNDYLPFGEKLAAGIGARTYQRGYVSDGTRQQFTGHERDAETGLDFMQARFYSSSQGRFTSVDAVSGTPSDPQSLNLYAYVLGNPLRYTDPTGHAPADIGVVQTDDPVTARAVQNSSHNAWIRQLAYDRQKSRNRRQNEQRTQTQQQRKPQTKPNPSAIQKQIDEINKNAKPLPPGKKPEPTTVVYLIGDNVTYNGDPVTLPDGKPDPYNPSSAYWGTGSINAIVVLDQGGNIMKGDGSIELGETITPDNDEARAMAKDGKIIASQNAAGQPERVPLAPTGIHWDRRLAVSDRNDVPAQFDVQVTQRLYVYVGGQGAFRMVNRHQITQNGAQSTLGQVQRFTRRQ